MPDISHGRRTATGSRSRSRPMPTTTGATRHRALDVDGRWAKRVSPADGRGYFAPVWIGEDRLGALSTGRDGYDVVVLNLRNGSKRILGRLPTADCDWSPDRTRIAYVSPERAAVNPGALTTLRLFETHLRSPVPGNSSREICCIEFVGVVLAPPAVLSKELGGTSPPLPEFLLPQRTTLLFMRHQAMRHQEVKE